MWLLLRFPPRPEQCPCLGLQPRVDTHPAGVVRCTPRFPVLSSCLDDQLAFGVSGAGLPADAVGSLSQAVVEVPFS